MTRIERLLSQFIGGKQPAEPTGDVTVTLARDDLEAAVGSMSWLLPTLEDHTPSGEAVRAHSEACFRAQRAMQAALR